MSTKPKMSGKTKKPPTKAKEKSNAKKNKTPIKEVSRPSTRRKAESGDKTSPSRYKDTKWSEQDYLQLSLRITEDIISTQRYKNEEMVFVLKRHYQENKAHLNKAKLLKTIAQLCSELSISMDPDFVHFLDDTENNYRVCCPKNSYSCSPLHFETSPSHNALPAKPGRVTEQPLASMERIIHSLQAINQPQAANCEETRVKSGSFEVVKAPPLSDKTSSDIFEFNEEVLETLVGTTILDSSEDVMDKEMKNSKEFLELNDATLVLFYFRTLVSSLVSTLDKIEKNLVTEHYSVSVEPEIIDKKEFSVQVTLDATNQKQSIVSIVNINNDFVRGLQFETMRDARSSQEDMENARFRNSPYLVLDCPVLDLDCAENQGPHHKSVLDIHVPRTTANSNESWSIMNLLNDNHVYDSDHYDLTPQKEVFSKKNNFLENKIVLSYNQGGINEGHSDKSKKVGGKMAIDGRDTMDVVPRGRGERYKKVYENLSCFYPTTATQVNSMDILENFCREAQVNTSHHIFADSDTSDPSSYTNGSSIQKALPVARGETRRIEALPNDHQQSTAVVRTTHEKSARGQSNRRRSVQFVTPEDVDEESSSGRSPTIYPSTENIQKRILGLKFDLGRYANEAHTSRKVESPRRVEVTSILKNYTLGSASTSQSSEASQNRPKRLTILRKHAKMKL